MQHAQAHARCRQWLLAGALAGVLAAGASIAAEQPSTGRTGSGGRRAEAAPDNKAFEGALRAELRQLNERFASADSPGDLTSSAERLFDLAIAHALPGADAALGRDINLLRRQVRQLTELRPDQVEPTRKLLAANPGLARAVAYAIGPEDSAPGAYAVLRLLAEKFPDRVLESPEPAKKSGGGKGHTDLSNLVAAFCIVHDGPSGRDAAAGGGPANPNPTIDEARVTALFEYFSTNAGKLAFGPSTTPELLAYVVNVDPRVTIDDLNWALKGYAGNKTVGKLYKTIVYDTAHFKRGTPKKVEQAPGGVTLQNIRKFGGVCVEQAMFAANVGKAIGVPTVEVIGRGADVGHAWVGYLKAVGSGRFAWDFDEGRYDEYKDLRGTVLDARTGTRVPDGYIGLSAGLASTGAGGSAQALAAAAAAREDAAMFFDAAERLSIVEGTRLAYPPAYSGEAQPVTPVRPLGAATQLELIEVGLRKVPAMRRGWELVARLAASRRMTLDQLKTWSERVIELCANDFPDFAFDALKPMIGAVGDIKEQDRLWEWTAGRFNARKDLAAAATLARGDLWRESEPRRAWGYYQDVIERYPNDGQIILEALERAEHQLALENKADQIVELYRGAWSRVAKPKSAASEFTRGSSYVIVGSKYAQLLEQSGRPVDAKKIRDAVKDVLEK